MDRKAKRKCSRKKLTREHYRAIGRKGGQATLAKYGRQHFREIGRLGYQTILTRYWQSDALGYRRWLCAKGWNAAIEALTDRELDRQLANGATIAVVELPPPLDDEELWDYRAAISEAQYRYEHRILF
jgi:general stress protein YciG